MSGVNLEARLRPLLETRSSLLYNACTVKSPHMRECPMQQPASKRPSTSSVLAEPRRDRRWLALQLIGMLLLLLGYAFAFFQVGNYEAGIVRRTFTVSGAIPVPVIYLHPVNRRGDAIAVIVHGYSGSKEVMIGFGLELARMGVSSYLLDLPGH